MRKLEIIFVTPKHGLIKGLISSLVRAVTGSQWSHVGMHFYGGVFEAVAPKVDIYPKEKYAPGTYEFKEVIPLAVTDHGYGLVMMSVDNYLKKDIRYGIKTCLIGGANTLFGKKVAKRVKDVLKPKNIDNCSSTITNTLFAAPELASYLRALGISKSDHDLVVPQELYANIKAISYKQKALYGEEFWNYES